MDSQHQYVSPAEFVRRSSLSLSSVRRRMEDGRLPYLQPGGPRSRILIPIDALVKPTIPHVIQGDAPSQQTLEEKETETLSAKEISGSHPKWLKNLHLPHAS